MTLTPPLASKYHRRELLARSAAGAALGAGGLAGFSAPAHAQQGTPVATPSGETDVAAAQLRYMHPEKIYHYIPGFQDESLLAALFSLDVETYREILDQFAATVRGAAEELLTDESFAGLVDTLPFQPGSKVVALGESDSDDLLSAIEILRHLLDLRRPSDEITVVNLAISGQSTSEAIGRLPAQLVEYEPDWLICGLGGNDTLRYGHEATKTRISIAETELNLTELHHLATTQSQTEWVWVTRWTIDVDRIAEYPPFKEFGITIRPDDWNAVNAFVRKQEGLVVDLEPVFGQPPVPEYIEFDGFHPTLIGQREIVRALVERLAT